MTKSKFKHSSHAATPAGARDGSPSYDDRLMMLERAFNPAGEPVIGFYVYSAATALIRGLNRNKIFRAIVPHLIGTPAVLSARPGISQTELAGYLGCERATAGKQVAVCLKRGWIRREVAHQDKRRFALYITPKGRRMLRKVSTIIPRHEREYTAALSAAERRTLRGLLQKLILG